MLSKYHYKKTLEAAQKKSVDDIIDILLQVPILARCGEAHLRTIYYYCKPIEFNRGDYVYKEKDNADKMYIVKKGCFNVLLYYNEMVAGEENKDIIKSRWNKGTIYFE